MITNIIKNIPINGSDNLIEENWCSTRINTVKLTYTWRITRFCFNAEFERCLNSSIFSEKGNNLSWYLKIHPNGINDLNKDYVSIYLWLHRCNQSYVVAKFKMSIVNSNMQMVHSLSAVRAYRFRPGCNWGFHKFIRKSYLLQNASELLPEDTLTIFCQISVLKERINIFGRVNNSSPYVPNCELGNDFRKVLVNTKFADIVLTAGNRKFPAHKAILSARSTVFAAMFEHEMLENKENSVKIVDVDPEIFEEVLAFIYTGSANVLKHTAKRLLTAADMYALDRLKALCEVNLCQHLSIQNAADSLIFADLYRAEYLKELATQLIRTHIMAVMKTPGWQSIVRSHPHLLEKVIFGFSMTQVLPVDPSQISPK